MKKLRKYLVLILMLTLTFGCGTTSSPDDVVKDFFSAAQEFDMAKLVATIVPENTVATAYAQDIFDEEQVDEFPEEFLNYLKDSAGKMTYTITSTTIDDDQATVMVDVSYIDSYPLLEELISEYMMQAMTMAFSGQELSDEDAQKMMSEIFTAKLADYTDNFKDVSIEIPCMKVDDKWYISDVSEDMMDIYLSGFVMAAATFQESFNQ